MNNLEVFYDTQNLIRGNGSLHRATERAISHTYVVEEGFQSAKNPHVENCRVRFEENLTLAAALRYVDGGKKAAVLNFANPVEPGGGVWRGSNAQEEYLCRASNLYNCLSSRNAASFYAFHNGILEKNQFRSFFLASDRIVYSPRVTVFKVDQPGPEGMRQVYTNQWREVDVITCAAPFFDRTDHMLANGDLYYLFCRRIQNILEVAIDNGAEALILGAFGCGAFHNPPAVVAGAFADMLLRERYRKAFTDVVFAVKRSGSSSDNNDVFRNAFSVFPPAGGHGFHL